jgi:hypothetical protein
MAIRVSPTEQNPTHHFSLQDRYGKKLGLTLCKTDGTALDIYDPSAYIKSPVETTAQKQTSGSSSYADFDYPYSPIVQDDLSGGRGGLDYERDSTKYYDSYRCRSSRTNKAYAGPLEQYTTGLRNQNGTLPDSVKWVQLTDTQRYIYKRFLATASYTTGRAWLLARRKGSPASLTIAIYSDSAGSVGVQLSVITVASTRLEDTLSEWLNETISQALTSGTAYWLVIYGAASDGNDAHWKVACNNAAGGTYVSSTFDGTRSASAFDLYYRLTDANTNKACIPYEYKEQQYFCISEATGAPKLYQAGDRGTADANTGQLNKLIDATKTWTINEWVGHVAMLTDGTGKLERQTWRIVQSNDGTSLTFTDSWTITHDTTTEYVILGTKLTEITGHGLTAPVTSILVSTTGVIYFCMGDSVTVRRMRESTVTGVWTREYAAETAATKAVFMVYKPQAQKIVIANNSDATGFVSVSHSSNATVPEWGTALTWATAVKVDSKYRKITGMIVYPDGSDAESVWVFKTDIPFIVPGTGNPYPINLPEMKTVRSNNNGVNPIVNNVYLYFPMLQGLERYYGGQIDDIGPNLGEGLPLNRRGPIVSIQGYPGKFFIAIDAGDAGYSSIMDSGGWHERYRAPKGQRITATAFQVIPGSGLDRFWFYQGNDLIWLPFPSDTTDELQDVNYPYAPEFSVTLSRMHAGMFDTQKMIKKIKMQTQGLELDEQTGEPICWIELDYRLDENSEWVPIEDAFTTSPTQEVDFTNLYGVAGKRVQFRFRGYTTDSSKTAVFIAIIIGAVLRVDVKNFYGPFTFRLMDDESVMGLRERERETPAAEALQTMENWADASNDSMLLMRSISGLCDKQMIFLNMGARRQIAFKGTADNPYKSDVYVISATMQEA